MIPSKQIRGHVSLVQCPKEGGTWDLESASWCLNLGLTNYQKQFTVGKSVNLSGPPFSFFVKWVVVN